MTPSHRGTVPGGARAVVASVVLASAAAACGGASPAGPSASRTTASSTSSPTTSSLAPPVAVTVVDSTGGRFRLQASPVASAPTVTVDGQPRFAPPGQTYLVETLDVSAVPGQGPLSLAGFDNRDTGLSDDIVLVLDAPTAAAHGYGTDCGVDADFPPSQCPVTLGQGLTVDSNSVAHASDAGALLGADHATIVLSYGPVPAGFPVASLSVWFHSGSLAPTALTS